MALGIAPFAQPMTRVAVPWPGAAIDMDFVSRLYWWGGSSKLEANFTTFNLNGSTFGPNGLTPTGTIDVTLSLSGLGTFVPGAYASAIYQTGAPSTGAIFWTLDDGTSLERVSCAQNVTPVFVAAVVVGNVAQANLIGPGGLATRIGASASYAVNDIKGAANGIALTPDTVATMPTITTLRIGRRATANTQALGSVARVVLFTAVKTQTELNALSAAIGASP